MNVALLYVRVFFSVDLASNASVLHQERTVYRLLVAA